MVSWTDASACSGRANACHRSRWEYAARGPEYTYPWGDTAPTAALARFGGQHRAVEGTPCRRGHPRRRRHLAGNASGCMTGGTPPTPPARRGPPKPAEGDYRGARGSWSSPADDARQRPRLFQPGQGRRVYRLPLRPQPARRPLMAPAPLSLGQVKGPLKIHSRLLDTELWLVPEGYAGPALDAPVYTAAECRLLVALQLGRAVAGIDLVKEHSPGN